MAETHTHNAALSHLHEATPEIRRKKKKKKTKKGQIDILELGLAVFLESAIDVRALR
jgi:hypothetical protein